MNHVKNLTNHLLQKILLCRLTKMNESRKTPQCLLLVKNVCNVNMRHFTHELSVTLLLALPLLAGRGWMKGRVGSEELFEFLPLSFDSGDERSGVLRKKKKKQLPVLLRHAELGFNLAMLGPRLRPFSTLVATISSQALRWGKKGGRNPLLSLSKSDENTSLARMATPASLANGYDTLHLIPY